MRICVMTGATHALDSCTKATGRRHAASHLVSPSRLQVASSHIFWKSVIFIYVTGAILYFGALSAQYSAAAAAG